MSDAPMGGESEKTKLEEIKKLMKKSRSNYESAELNFKTGYYDAALSRAYYSMFYLAEAVLLTKNMRVSKHSGVISAFGQHFAAIGEIEPKLHRMLIESGKQRNMGDYDYMYDVTAEEVENVLRTALDFNAGVESYLGKYLDMFSDLQF